MIDTANLEKKKCLPCEGIGKALTKEEAQQYLKGTPGWNLREDGKLIWREFIMKNFMAAIKLIHNIAQVAEAENHHPDLHLVSYRKLRIELTTHALGGLTENDFILAAKISTLPADLKP